MTPSQLRAFAAVVRLGSVKSAASELGVSEAAVSLHVGQLRKELGDRLFLRTGAGLAFTPGGLRLATRAAELLGLQDRTILEVSQAGSGRRLLRVAASSLFAEHSAPGLIELFAGRAQDLDVELSVHDAREFPDLLRMRAVDVAIGPQPAEIGQGLVAVPVLNYQVVAVAGPQHALARIPASITQLQEQTWLLGPSAAAPFGLMPAILRRIHVPESNQQIFQSHTAALEEAKHGRGIALALASAASQDLTAGNLRRISNQHLQSTGLWNLLRLDERGGSSAAEEFARFATTPRATHAMLRGPGVTVGRFRPSIHVTLWS